MINRGTSKRRDIDVFAICPLCNAKHSKPDARKLGARGKTCVWHIQCKRCNGVVLAFVMKERDFIGSVGMVTDLSFDDVSRFLNQTSVSADDVLRAHQILKSPECLHKISGNTA